MCVKYVYMKRNYLLILNLLGCNMLGKNTFFYFKFICYFKYLQTEDRKVQDKNVEYTVSKALLINVNMFSNCKLLSLP